MVPPSESTAVSGGPFWAQGRRLSQGRRCKGQGRENAWRSVQAPQAPGVRLPCLQAPEAELSTSRRWVVKDLMRWWFLEVGWS